MNKILIIAAFFPISLFALEPLSPEEMADTSGQGGVYLTGDLTINENGGPLNVDGPGLWQKDCQTGSDKLCGARLAVQTGEGRGWLVLDNMRGRFSFEGLTLRTRRIDEGFSGDGEAFDQDVFEIGLPNQLEFENSSYTIAGSGGPRPTDNNYRQTDIATFTTNGVSNLQGNLLIFPTGTP